MALATVAVTGVVLAVMHRFVPGTRRFTFRKASGKVSGRGTQLLPHVSIAA
jgi:hypothetical protein